MTAALPPLPDHRAAVLRALDALGATYQAFGCTTGTIAAAADLDAGEAWLAVTQCAHAGLVLAFDDGMLTEDRAIRTWSLTAEGRSAVDKIKGDPLPPASNDLRDDLRAIVLRAMTASTGIVSRTREDIVNEAIGAMEELGVCDRHPEPVQ